MADDLDQGVVIAPVPQTGFLVRFTGEDYTAGALASVEVNPLSDWREYLPTPEKQFKDFTFDTMSCTTFSAINTIETWMNFLLKNKQFTLAQEILLHEYIDEEGKFNFSDRFTAIVSGTTQLGNYFQAVLDSIRKDGLLPEKDLPFGGNSWDEYHNKAVITQAMRDKALKIKDIITVAYEWAPTGDALFNTLKCAPVQAAIPRMATHAILLPKLDYIFDTYPPFLYSRNVELGYAMKIVVCPKATIAPTPPPVTYKYFSQAEVAKWKLKPELWELLDKIRGECGFPFVITSGLRTKAENDALKDSVSDSAHLSSIAVDISCTDSVRRFKMIDVARKNGVNRFGIGKTFLHMDISKILPQNVIWIYS